MNIVASVTVCFIPLIAVFVCLKLLMKEFTLLDGFKAVILGMVAVIPIAAAVYGLGFLNMNYTSLQLSLVTLLLYGLVEEAIKMVMMFFFGVKKTSLKTFVAYGALLGLTFGCFESLIYLFIDNANFGLRLLTSVVIHVSGTYLSSIFVYSIKTKKVSFLPFLFAFLCHGLYNYFVGYPEPFKYFAYAVIAFALIECRIRYIAEKNAFSQEIASKGASAQVASSPKKEEKKSESLKKAEPAKKVETARSKDEPKPFEAKKEVAKAEPAKTSGRTSWPDPWAETFNKASSDEKTKASSEPRPYVKPAFINDKPLPTVDLFKVSDKIDVVDPVQEENAISEAELNSIEKSQASEDPTIFKLSLSGPNLKSPTHEEVSKTLVKATRKTTVKGEAKPSTAKKTTAKASSASKTTTAKKSTTASTKSSTAKKSTAKTTAAAKTASSTTKKTASAASKATGTTSAAKKSTAKSSTTKAASTKSSTAKTTSTTRKTTKK